MIIMKRMIVVVGDYVFGLINNISQKYFNKIILYEIKYNIICIY